MNNAVNTMAAEEMRIHAGLPGSSARVNDSEISFNALWRIIVRRRSVVACSVAVASLLAIAGSLLMTPKYAARATLEVNPQNTDVVGAIAGDVTSNTPAGMEGMDYNVTLATETRMIESDSMALEVARDLNLESHEPFAPHKPLISLPSFPSLRASRKRAESVDYNVPLDRSPERRTGFLLKFHANLGVKAVAGTRMVDIGFRNPDPELAAAVVNDLVKVYLERHFHTRFAATVQASSWLSKELAQLRKDVEDAQEKVVQYQRENGILILGPEDSKTLVAAKLAELNTQVTNAEGNRILKEAAWNLSQTGDPEIISALAGGETGISAKGPASLLITVRTQRADLEKERAQMAAKFGPAYPRLVQLERQIEDVNAAVKQETARVIDRMKAEYDAALESETLLKASLEKQKQEAHDLNDRAIQFMVLKHAAESRRDLYETMQKKLTEAGLLAGIRSSNIIVVDLASAPSQPATPNPPLYLALALGAGLFGGLALAFVAENMDETIRTPEQVESMLALPSVIIPRSTARLAAIPDRLLPAPETKGSPGKAVNLRHFRGWAEPPNHLAEAYRMLRTFLLLSGGHQPPKRIVITSALPREGKTTTALHLAAMLGGNGARVLLIEADMRRAPSHYRTGLAASTGLSTILRGEASGAAGRRQCEEIPGLWILPPGPEPLNPAELLTRPKFRELLDEASQEFDHIVIDTPPVLSVTDPVLIAAAADAVLLVARFGVTGRHALAIARETLHRARARVIGVVINCADLNSPDYYYYSNRRYGRYYLMQDQPKNRG